MIVGCLPPFKSLFLGGGSSQRYKPPVYDKNLSSGLPLDAIQLGSAETGAGGKAAPKVMSRPIDREEDCSMVGTGEVMPCHAD